MITKPKYFILVVILLTTFSCSNDTDSDEQPENIIGPDKMISLIIELQILESHFQRTYHSPVIYKTSLENSSQLIFDKYAVRKSQFDSSYSFYSKNTKTMYEIYESALDSLNFSSMEY